MEKSALHRLSLSGEGNGARGVVACLPQSYFNVGWERKAHQARPACAKADAESLGGTQGLRLVGSMKEQAAGCQQGLLSAVLGALCWLQEQLPGCPWPCMAHTQQVVLQGDRSTWFWWRVVKILSLLPVWSSLASLGCTCGGQRCAGVVKAPCFLAG